MKPRIKSENQHSEAPPDPVLLDHLLNRDGFIPVHDLAARLARPLTAVNRDLETLVHAGCRIDRHPQQGVRLRSSGIATWSDYLEWRLARDESGASARVRAVYAQTSSTQDLVRTAIEAEGAGSDGSIYIADEQTAGRGRLGRRWQAPPGTAILFSRAYVAPQRDPSMTVDRLMLASVIGTARGIDAACAGRAPELDVRWPNDLLAGRRKLAGILVEQFTAGHRRAAVIGIGVNVSLTEDRIPDTTPPLRDTLTSLAMHGLDVDRLAVLAAVILGVEKALREPDTAQLAAEWRRRSALIGRRVALRHDGRIVRGQAVDIDPREGLVVRTDAGVVVHLPGESSSLVD
ncbi:MAG: biotin--[acetyl-CoA-carboxylase] ligase [Phycisphaeraceae bacterium]|nr:biotin--[acetyl-CoA-carboxylase] ligase [Phycisphaeraceae bacterium]